MKMQIERRVAALEATQVDVCALTPEEQHAGMVALAQRCGLSEAQVIERFGNWPAFAYAVMTRVVIDPSRPVDPPRRPTSASPLEEYLAMIKTAGRQR